MAEALSPQPPINWIVEPLFSAGSLVVPAGDPGSKKTYSLLDLDVCVATGKPWLRFQTKQCPVLIIDEESGERRLNRRLGDILRAHSAGPDTPLQYVTLAHFDLRKEGDVVSVGRAYQKVWGEARKHR